MRRSAIRSGRQHRAQRELHHLTQQLNSKANAHFNYDFGVAFTEEQQRNGADYNFQHVDKPAPQREGMSAFALQDGVVHHTYSTYNRGVEALMGTYQVLDLAPWGRNEDGLESPNTWWRRHDEYGLP